MPWRLLKHLTAALCLYEAFAIWSRRVPTLSRITYMYRHSHKPHTRLVWGVAALGLGWHLFYQEHEWNSEATPRP